MLNTKYAVLSLLIFAGVYGCSQEPQDLSIPMKAGEYQISVSKVADGIKNTLKRSKVRCYRESVFDPYNSQHQNKDCKIYNISKSNTDVSFDFDCTKGAAVEAKGKMMYSVNGDRIRWSSSVSSISGNDVDITSSGKGEYLGKCK